MRQYGDTYILHQWLLFMVLFHILKALSICTLYASWKTGAPGWWRHLAEKQNIISPPYSATVWLWHKFIDLSTDTAAILNLLDLRSIMGCPWGTCSVFTHTFRAKKDLQCIFLGKKAIISTFKHGTTIFFPITIFV